MNTNKHEKFIDKIEDDFYRRAIEYGKAEFDRIVKPYLDKHGYEFLAGNGTWGIFDNNDLVYYQLPKRILALLETTVANQDLGSLLPDYIPNKQ